MLSILLKSLPNLCLLSHRVIYILVDARLSAFPASLRSPVFPPLLPVLSKCLVYSISFPLLKPLQTSILLILFPIFLSSPSVLESSSNLQTASAILPFHGSVLEEARFSRENRQSRREAEQDGRDVQAYTPHLLKSVTRGFCGGVG